MRKLSSAALCAGLLICSSAALSVAQESGSSVTPAAPSAANTSTVSAAKLYNDLKNSKYILRLDTDTLTTRRENERNISGYQTQYTFYPGYKVSSKSTLYLMPELMMMRDYARETKKDQGYMTKLDTLGFRFDQRNILTEDHYGVNHSIRLYGRLRPTTEARKRNTEKSHLEFRNYLSKKIGRYSIDNLYRVYLSDTKNDLDPNKNATYYYHLLYLTQTYEINNDWKGFLYMKNTSFRTKGENKVTSGDKLYVGPGFGHKVNDKFDVEWKLASTVYRSHAPNIFPNNLESVIDLSYDLSAQLSIFLEVINPLMVARPSNRGGDFSVSSAVKKGTTAELALTMFAW